MPSPKNSSLPRGGTRAVGIDDDYLNVKVSKPPKLYWLAFFLVIVFPLAVMAIAAAMGGIMAAVEKAAFVDCFLYIVSNMLAFSNPLTEFNVNDALGIVVDVYVSVISLMMFGVVINVVRVFRLPEKIDNSLERRLGLTGFWRPFVAFGFMIPFIISMIACFFGILLALAEGWSIHDGILYVIGNLLSLGTALTPIIPSTIWGDLIDIFISSVALGCTALFVDYVSIVNPSRYVRKRLHEHTSRRTGLRNSPSLDLELEMEEGQEPPNEVQLFSEHNSSSHDDEDPDLRKAGQEGGVGEEPADSSQGHPSYDEMPRIEKTATGDTDATC